MEIEKRGNEVAKAATRAAHSLVDEDRRSGDDAACETTAVEVTSHELVEDTKDSELDTIELTFEEAPESVVRMVPSAPEHDGGITAQLAVDTEMMPLSVPAIPFESSFLDSGDSTPAEVAVRRSDPGISLFGEEAVGKAASELSQATLFQHQACHNFGSYR